MTHLAGYLYEKYDFPSLTEQRTFFQTADYKCSVLEMDVDVCAKHKMFITNLVMSNFIIKQNNNRQKPSLTQFATEPRTVGLSYVKHCEVAGKVTATTSQYRLFIITYIPSNTCSVIISKFHEARFTTS